jgi:hypothetical protein
MSSGIGFHQPAIYQIRVNASLNPDWAFWFENFQIFEEKDGSSLLIGKIEDQSALFGLISKIFNLGLTLISLNQLDYPAEKHLFPEQSR